MKKLIVVFLSAVVLLLNSGINVNATGKNNYNANGYGDFYSTIVYTLQNNMADVTIRLNNYNASKYDLNRVMNQIQKEKPELYICYRGYKFQQESFYTRQTYRIEHIYFTYRSNPSEINKMKQSNSYNQFYNIYAAALSNFDDKLIVKVNNYNESLYNFNVINNIINRNEDINYGYNGMSWRIEGAGNSRVITISFRYKLTKETMIEMKRRVDVKAKQIINTVLKPGMSAYEKELVLHDYLINNAKYDYVNFKANTVPTEEHTSYGVLIKKIGVCDSYARAMLKLLNMSGINCIIVRGTGKGQAHSWNIVKIDGKYYQLDTTWDDPVSPSGRNVLRHDYFNITDSQMARDHIWNYKDYPRCNSKAAQFGTSK